MDPDSIRQEASRQLSQSLFRRLARYWSGRLPLAGKHAAQRRLLEQHRVTLRIANLSTVLALLAGIAAIKLKMLSASDWRGLGLTLGLSALLPVLAIPLVTAIRRGFLIPAFQAYALSQRVPTGVLYALLSCLIALGCVSMALLWMSR